VTRPRHRAGAASRYSGESALAGPVGQLVPIRKLELAKDRGDVTLDCLNRNVEFASDVAIDIPTRDQPQHLSLPGRELIQVRVHARRRGTGRGHGEGVENETSESREKTTSPSFTR